MPGKSRRQKEKKYIKPAAVSEQPASVVVPALQVAVNQPPPVKSAPAPAPATAKAAAATSGDVKQELLMITVMTGIMLLVVVILSIVLH